MFSRTIEPVLRELAGAYPVVTVTGPRQSGKTTLCRSVFADRSYANLENLDLREFAEQDPRGFLKGYPDGGVLDEVQRAPKLLSYLQNIVDEDPRKGLFILTGSQQFEVAAKVNQSLAGRTTLLKLLPLSIEELAGHVDTRVIDRLLAAGFYPRIHNEGLDPTRALGDYVETYVERDIRLLVNIQNLGLFQKFLRLCSGRVGQLLNLQSLANDVGISHTTARAWLSVLEASYIVFLLPPYHANVSKRLIKTPKLYFYDVGLASHLLGIESEIHASRHPLRGNLFENLVVAEVLKYRFHQGKRPNLSFYRDSTGNEVDLLFGVGPDVVPVEIKAGATVSQDYFRGLRSFGKTLPQFGALGAVVYAGDDVQERGGSLVYPFWRVHELLRRIEGAPGDSG